MAEVVTLGETMIRLSPPGNARLEQASSFDVVIGGSEQSVAAGLAYLGREVAFVTRLPHGPLGRLALNKTREVGIDVSHTVYGDERLGLYFYEQGVTPRPSQVVYDRALSATAALRPWDVDWPSTFQQCRLFHTSGITAALSETCMATVEHALTEARRHGVTTSFDLNYRSRLWSLADAAAAFRRVAPLTNVLFASSEALATFFDAHGTPEAAARAVQRAYGCDVVVLTERIEEGAGRGKLSALAVAQETIHGDMVTFEVVDRLGAGDTFVAGFLDGYLDGNLDKAIAQGTVLSALKHTMPGEFCLVTRQELQLALAGTSRQVIR